MSAATTLKQVLDERYHAGPASMVMLLAPGTTKAGADRFTGDVWVDSITGGAGPGSRDWLSGGSPQARGPHGTATSMAKPCT